MQQFVVPQFIEVESKVIGPISVRQFIILLVTAGIIYIWFELFSLVVFAILGVVTLAIGGVFAFAKVNSQSFHVFLLSFIQTMKRPKLSVWRREHPIKAIEKKGRKDKKDKKDDTEFTPKPDVSQSHLAELALIMDTEGQYSPQDIEQLRKEQHAEVPAPVQLPKDDLVDLNAEQPSPQNSNEREQQQ